MYFTSGSDRVFERRMQEKPRFDYYGSGGRGGRVDCGTCRFYRPDWKYQFCRFAECPYQPGKLTDFAAVKFTVKRGNNAMAVFRVEKNKGYTVTSNHHLRNIDYTLKGLPHITGESIDAIRQVIRELERTGYIMRSKERDEKGWLCGADYVIYEQPHTPSTMWEKP